MKRDLDLVRDILLAVEADPREGLVFLNLEKYSKRDVSNHVLLLTEAGYLESTVMEGEFIPTHMTWQGHEFLEAARNDTIWERAKEQIKKEGLGMALPILLNLLITLGKQAAGLP